MIYKQQIGRFVHFSTVFSKETWKREFCLKIAFKKRDAVMSWKFKLCTTISIILQSNLVNADSPIAAQLKKLHFLA